jgi:hypothetical protein
VGSFQNGAMATRTFIIEDDGLAQKYLKQFITVLLLELITNGLELLIQGFFIMPDGRN